MDYNPPMTAHFLNPLWLLLNICGTHGRFMSYVSSCSFCLLYTFKALYKEECKSKGNGSKRCRLCGFSYTYVSTAYWHHLPSLPSQHELLELHVVNIILFHWALTVIGFPVCWQISISAWVMVESPSTNKIHIYKVIIIILSSPDNSDKNAFSSDYVWFGLVLWSFDVLWWFLIEMFIFSSHEQEKET